MDLYKIGKIVSIGKTYIILESSYTGMIVYVPLPQAWEEDKDHIRKVYIYNYTTEYTKAIYGFKSFSERVLFEDLINISGIGPRTALGLLKQGNELTMDMIARGDVTGLSQMPQLGIKSANQIVFELKSKYERFADKKAKGKVAPSQIKASLKTLGFNAKQINYAVEHVEAADNIELMVENAIKLISDAKFAKAA